MTLNEQRKLSKHIFRLLKVTEIAYPIGRTSKGNLGVVFNANNDDFDVMLDSIPLSTKNSLEDENNIELKKMIEKYMFEQENTLVFGQTALEKHIHNGSDEFYVPINQEVLDTNVPAKKVTKKTNK